MISRKQDICVIIDNTICKNMEYQFKHGYQSVFSTVQARLEETNK